MSSRRVYRVEYFQHGIGWRPYIGASGSLEWCKGFVAAIDMQYPSDPLRIVDTSDGRNSVAHETKGRGRVHLS